MSGGSFREVSSKSWGNRLLESIKGVAVGLLLFIISFPLLFWNEGRAVDTAKALEQGKGDVVEANTQAVDPAHEGKEVHVTGEATTKEMLEDPDFNTSSNALRLRRKVEMYQWKENVKTETHKKLGGGEEEVKTYTYSKAWSDRPIDSESFKKPDEHANPPMPYQSQVWNAQQIKLGAFDLPVKLVDDLGEDKEERLPAKKDARTTQPAGTKVPAAGAKDKKENPSAEKDSKDESPADQDEAEKSPAKTQVLPDGLLYQGRNPSAPAVGDMRIEFKVLKQPRAVSVLAKQVGTSFEPYAVKGRQFTIYRLMDGSKSAVEMFAQMEQENTVLTWALRLVGFVLMAVGIFLMLRPVATFGDVVPFMGSLMSAGIALLAGITALALSLLTIGVGWLFYRPLLGGGLLAAALALFGFLCYLVYRFRRRRAALGNQAGPG